MECLVLIWHLQTFAQWPVFCYKHYSMLTKMTCILLHTLQYVDQKKSILMVGYWNKLQALLHELSTNIWRPTRIQMALGSSAHKVTVKYQQELRWAKQTYGKKASLPWHTSNNFYTLYIHEKIVKQTWKINKMV
jgi:hypothetical protein